MVGRVGIEPDLNNFIRVALAYQLDFCPYTPVLLSREQEFIFLFFYVLAFLLAF